MTDNRDEVVAYADSADERYVTLIRLTPAEDADIPLVPQSLLIAAREEADRRTRELELTYVVQRDLRLRAERAEAELAECRRDAERYRWMRANHVRRWEYDVPNDSSAKSLDLDFEAEGHDLDAAIDAAIDACVGGEVG